ncbi:helix-turn-helix transcriptional regulator [Rariglobus hedericola]|uniref:YafY family transcriptional regulator n=1 Tax=Rariglobus hedericola TaxID=2597822 RepID=A0A556QLI9_9BACT|nr:YafY family protein [Rariglobus hedericola]TSJ77493.1 YafY family transcriptional regulator [Rariglobus hedericola]
MNRTDRLVGMVMHLQGRRVVRAEELAEHYGISVRTVYRDIAALGEAGVPVVGEAGVGYSLVKGYHLPPVMLTVEEAGALFTGGELAKKFTDGSLDAAVDGALNKLRAVLPGDRKDHLEHLARGTVIASMPGSPVAGAGGGPPCLAAVQQAVARRRVLALSYRAREKQEDTMREVESLGVVFYGGNWYLVAWCRLRKDLRHFRVDRIQNLELRSETFGTREDFSLSRHIEDYARQGETFPAKIWLAREVQERARAESYATLVAGEERDGGAEFSILTWSYDWLARWLMSFADKAEALEPVVLRDTVRAHAEAVVKRHRSPRKRS